MANVFCKQPMKAPYLLYLFLAVGTIVQSQQVFVTTNDVTFTISSIHHTYKIGDTIEFSYRIRNVSHAALYVPNRIWDLECPVVSGPHVWAEIEDMSGKHFSPGYGGSCLGPTKMDIRQRIQKEAVLLKPGETFQNSFQLETKMFVGQLMPGEYRLEATLYGWRDQNYSKDHRIALQSFGHPFLAGEIPASTTITLSF